MNMLIAARFGVVAIAAASLLVGCAPAEPAPAPSSAVDVPIEESPAPQNSSDPSLTMLVDGVEWSGTAPSASFFAGGAPSLDPEGRTYLQLAFPSATSPDARQLTFGIFAFTGTIGPWQDLAEVNFSGSPTGGSDDVSTQGYQYDVPEQKTDFVFEVTKWESTGATTAVMSATFSGGLVGILGAGPTTISNGVITDIEVVVYPDPF
jgi:hypothetical protein